MTQPRAMKMILFDMDNCLFDHLFSLRCAASALQRCINSHPSVTSRVHCKIPFPRDQSFFHMDEDAALQRTHVDQAEQLFTDHGLPQPSLEEVEALYAIYKDAYGKSRRAAPGSVRAVARLREDGYQIASMSAHAFEKHEAMARFLGFGDLVDVMVTAPDVATQHAEDSELLDYAVGQMHHPALAVVVVRRHNNSAASISSNPGMTVMLRSSPSPSPSPARHSSQCGGAEQGTRTMASFDQLLDHLHVRTRRFAPTISCIRGGSSGSTMVLEGFGMDLVTEPRAGGFYVSKRVARSLVEKMGTVLVHVAQRLHVAALTELGEMMRMIAGAGAAPPPGGAKLRILIPGGGGHQQAKTTRDESPSPPPPPPCVVVVAVERRHSILAEMARLDLDTDAHTDPILRATADCLRSHCGHLTREHPRQAMRSLRSAMITVAEAAGLREDLLIAGDNIEPWIGSRTRRGEDKGNGGDDACLPSAFGRD
ncbi:hypothetical protein C2857_006977 [Epichloe festucae Fl1]|uniref:Uncharacterized protein n=1 Tax=Epichloe festucae (strain Fl1) TaxID=877507 RepID=A0A7S9KTX5_EPIFF|nr:hypothetical protein C2857_006977 [Epichloe festucae Fl1]